MEKPHGHCVVFFYYALSGGKLTLGVSEPVLCETHAIGVELIED